MRAAKYMLLVILLGLCLTASCARVRVIQTDQDGSILWIIDGDSSEQTIYECCDECGDEGLPECRELQERLAEEAPPRKLKKPPLTPVSGKIVIDETNVPRLYARWKNTSDLAIASFLVEIQCFDSSGQPVNHYTNTSNIYHCQVVSKLKPGSRTPRWNFFYMEGYRKLARATVTVVSIRFTDGTSWKPAAGSPAPHMEVKLED